MALQMLLVSFLFFFRFCASSLAAFTGGELLNISNDFSVFYGTGNIYFGWWNSSSLWSSLETLQSLLG